MMPRIEPYDVKFCFTLELYTPDGYPHGQLLPMANGAGWLEEISGTRIGHGCRLHNILRYFYFMRIVN